LYIVSNPPYIAAHEYAGLDKEVRDYEPYQALVAEENGLFFYQQLARQASLFDHCAGIFFEVGYTQALAVTNILQQRFPGTLNIVRDLGGKERVVYTIL
jgi:release factor glutamine methyltransferase